MLNTIIDRQSLSVYIMILSLLCITYFNAPSSRIVYQARHAKNVGLLLAYFFIVIGKCFQKFCHCHVCMLFQIYKLKSQNPSTLLWNLSLRSFESHDHSYFFRFFHVCLERKHNSLTLWCACKLAICQFLAAYRNTPFKESQNTIFTSS